MIMLRKTYWYSMGWVYLIVTYPMLWLVRLYGRIGKIDKKESLADKMSSRICRVLFYLSGSKITLSGLENVPEEGAVLFVSNHQGHFDGLVIHGFIDKPKGFVSIIEASKAPVISTWMREMNSVFMDRKDLRQSLSCINEAIRLLQSGHSMVVFPEGKLSASAEPNEFNRGWLKLATRSGVPIVPVSIDGTYKAFGKNGEWVKAAHVKCVVSKPIYISAIKKADENTFVNNLKEIIMKHVSGSGFEVTNQSEPAEEKPLENLN
jgi:1-acyl-sn-glycerol-3-phosphate acyltransferase